MTTGSHAELEMLGILADRIQLVLEDQPMHLAMDALTRLLVAGALSWGADNDMNASAARALLVSAIDSAIEIYTGRGRAIQ
jgi:hypothetical protein